MTDSSLEQTRSAAASLSERWRAAWADAAPRTFGGCCAVGVQYEDPLVNEPLEGLDRLAEHARRLRRALPDLRLEASGQAIIEGSFACLPWRLLGSHKGEVAGVPASGRFLIIHGVHYVELTDGLVRRARGFFDLYDAAIQLGLLPAHGSLGESAILLLRGFGLRPRG